MPSCSLRRFLYFVDRDVGNEEIDEVTGILGKVAGIGTTGTGGVAKEADTGATTEDTDARMEEFDAGMEEAAAGGATEEVTPCRFLLTLACPTIFGGRQ